MKIRTAMLTLVAGVVISISGPVVSMIATHSAAAGDAATITPASSPTVTPDGSDPWPKP